MKKIITILALLLICFNAHAGSKLRSDYTDYCEDAEFCLRMNGTENNSLLDESGNDNHVVTNGGADYTTSGCKEGNCYTFISANSDYLAINDSSSLDIGTSDFSISVWVKRVTIDADATIVDKVDGPNNGYQWFFTASTNQQRFRIDSGTGSVGNSSTATTDTAEFHHYAVTCDRDGNAIFYLDGEADGTLDISGDSGDISNAINLAIGSNEDLAGAFLNGAMDELIVILRILTPEEITDIYNNGLK